MYPNFEGLTGCLIVLLVLALFGLLALILGAYYLLSNITITFG